ncbi:MAG: hypothetical protein ACK4WC_12940, partial [Rubrimonas sp.]
EAISGETLSASWGAFFDSQNAAAEIRLREMGNTFVEPTQALIDRLAAIRAILMRHVCPPQGDICHLASTPLPPGDDGVASPLQLTFRAYVDPRNVGRPEPFADLNDNGRWDPGEPFTDLNGNGRWDADMGVAGLGGSGDFVSFTVRMAQPVRHPALRAAFGAALIHETRFTVRNEPY